MDNLLLYRSLFKGREDVYAIHWSKGSKSGYMPAKLYDPYINKVYKKGTNPSSSEPINYLRLTDDQIQRHLEGRQLLGTQLEYAIPASKISALSSGEFVGIVADNPDQKIRLKVSIARYRTTTRPLPGRKLDINPFLLLKR